MQRVVRVCPNGTMMATGGTDGLIRLWAFPQLTRLREIEAHTKEIDDIDFTAGGSLMATVAKDSRAIIWKAKTGEKVKELSWTPPAGAKYMFKRCRFRMPEGKDSRTQLVTLSNASVGKMPSFVQLWDVEENTIVKSADYRETLAALAVSDDGRFVAVGTMFSGSVDILVAFSLNRVLHVQGAHSMFVTGLHFVPTQLDELPVTSNTEAAVVSISVDNRICIHSIPFRRKTHL